MQTTKTDPDTTTEIHPYYLERAGKGLKGASARPDADPRPVAAWAQARAGEEGADRLGVLVTDDGQVQGQTRHTPAGPASCGATYVTSVVDPRAAAAVGVEVGLAKGRVARAIGRPVVELRFGAVGRGASRQALQARH